MKLPSSTEWVLHCSATLAQLEPSETASAAQLAAYFDLPAPYLAKQLQSLVRAGILTATTGPRGGFRLGRPAGEITLLQVVEAVDGASSPYECREIRQQGAGALPAERLSQHLHPRREDGRRTRRVAPQPGRRVAGRRPGEPPRHRSGADPLQARRDQAWPLSAFGISRPCSMAFSGALTFFILRTPMKTISAAIST